MQLELLPKTHYPPKTRTICIDFDGVIHQYSKGYADGSIYDEPVEGAMDALINLVRKGYRIAIITSREDVLPIQQWLDKQLQARSYCQKTEGLILVTHQKIPADIYIDDRAIRFTNWTDILKYF